LWSASSPGRFTPGDDDDDDNNNEYLIGLNSFGVQGPGCDNLDVITVQFSLKSGTSL
jgi:hypothetical protein